MTMHEEIMRPLKDSLDRGTAGHLLAQLLELVDEGASELGEVVRRAGPPTLVEAAQRRRELVGFVDRVVSQPVDTWDRALRAAREHHGALLVILVANGALGRLPGEPLEALELTRAARGCAGDAGPEALDVEVRLLLAAIEGLAGQLLAQAGETGDGWLEPVVRSLSRIGQSIHPELMADTWWLVAVGRRLAGKLEPARSALRQAHSRAKEIDDELRMAQLHLEEAVVLELAERYEEACEADRKALRALQPVREHPLRCRAVVQRATHLVDSDRWEEAERVLDEGAELGLKGGYGPAVMRLRGRIAGGRGGFEEARLHLGAAAKAAALDGDVPEQALAILEELALSDELGRWDERRDATARLGELLAACPHAPAELSVAVAELRDVAAGETLASPVVTCLRRVLRRWQARRRTGVAVRVV